MAKFEFYVIENKETEEVAVGDVDILSFFKVPEEKLLEPGSGIKKYEVILKSPLTQRMQIEVDRASQVDPIRRPGVMVEQYVKSWGDLSDEQPSEQAFANLHPNIADILVAKLHKKIFPNLYASPDFTKLLGGAPPQ